MYPSKAEINPPLCCEKIERLTDPHDHRVGLRNKVWAGIGIPRSPWIGHYASLSWEKSPIFHHLCLPSSLSYRQRGRRWDAWMPWSPSRPILLIASIRYSGKEHSLSGACVLLDYSSPEFTNLEKGIVYPSTVQKRIIKCMKFYLMWG